MEDTHLLPWTETWDSMLDAPAGVLLECEKKLYVNRQWLVIVVYLGVS